MAKRKMSNADAIIKGLTGRKAKTTTTRHKLADIVKAHGTEGARERLGVSKSTWRRWQSGRGGPSKANLSKLNDAWDSKGVRSAMLGPRRKARLSQGFKMKARGLAGPSDDPAYWRLRQVLPEFTPEQAADIMDAFIERGPDGAHELITEFMSGEAYYGQSGPWEEGDPSHLSDITDIRMF